MRPVLIALFGGAFLVIVLIAGGWLGRARTAADDRAETNPERVLADLYALAVRDRDTLRARYPLGYVIVAVAGTRLYLAEGPPPGAGAPGVDWVRTRLESSVRTSVILQPPDVVAGGATLTAAPVRLPRIEGSQRAYLRGAGVEGWAEVLRADWTGFTCVLGLRPEVGGRRGG